MDAGDLIGRDDELRELTELIERVPDNGGAIEIVGPAGIGKSSLVRAAGRHARAAGLDVLETTGVESEARLPYAGLHQLLRPVLGAARTLPGPQRRALLSAFGAEDGPPPEAFVISLAALNLLTDAAANRPVLVAVDDAQWLDLATQEALAFVARRVGRDPVVVVAARRAGDEGPFAAAGLPELAVRALGDTAARRVLEAHAAGLSTAEREDILRAARGNPLALTELPIELPIELPAGRPAGAGRGPGALTDRLESAFAGRVARLPGPARDAVLIAAVDSADEVPEILAAASMLAARPLNADVLAAAAAAGLLRLDETRLCFRHPLIRSAILGAATPARTMAAHAALAEVLADQPYRRTWHRAQSVTGPDDEVADELEASHAISLRRGSVTSAIWALERSARLTADCARRGRRLLLAAEHAFSLGQADLVDRLLAAASRTALSELDRARMEWLRESSGGGADADAARVAELCVLAERSARAGAAELALNLLLGAALRCWCAKTDSAARARVATLAEELPGGRQDPRRVAAVAVTEPVLRGAVVAGLLAGISPAGLSDPDALRLLGLAAHAIGDLARAADLLARAELKLREQGRLGLLSQVLTMQIIDRLLMGDWECARAAAEEARQVADETGRPARPAGSLGLDAIAGAMRGETEQALKLAAAAESAADLGRPGNLPARVQLARGLAWAAAGRHAEAYKALRRLFDTGDPCHHQRASLDGVLFFAEAAAHSGHRDDARAVVAELERLAIVTPAPLLHIHLRYARAVLADDADAEELFRAALGADLTRWPLVKAKTELAFGGWLRRRRRAVEARAPLRKAQAAFDLLGATPWADQARVELHAAGEPVRRRIPSPLEALSAQELQIARLAAAGLSNREIGERLYLSPRTIGSHLYRIFPKLNVASRTQLASRLNR
jgi:DNA-binding CsgD family transcriptional regulator